MINTSEQLGGALGIAALTAVELGVNFHSSSTRSSPSRGSTRPRTRPNARAT